MQFKDIPGQAALKDRLVQGVHQNTVAHAQLFLGPIGAGNLAMSLAYAQFLNCLNPSENDSCGNCNACKKAQKYIHPDIHFTFPTVGAKSLSNTFLVEWRKALEKNVYLTSYYVVYDRDHYFGFGPILIQKPKLVDSFGRYRNRYRNHTSKGKSSYQ